MSKCGFQHRYPASKSQLFYELRDEVGINYGVKIFSITKTDEFIQKFGNWTLPIDEIINLSNSEDIEVNNEYRDLMSRLNESFEPRLFNEYGYLYFKLKNGQRYYINKNKFGDLSPAHVEDLVKSAIYSIYEKFPEISEKDITNLARDLRNTIDTYFEDFMKNNPLDAEEDRDSEEYKAYTEAYTDFIVPAIRANKEALIDETFRTLKNIGLKDLELNENDEADYENTSDTSSSGELNIKSSSYINHKISASFSMKLFLSFIPKYSYQYEGPGIEPYLVEDVGDVTRSRQFEDRDVVWNLVQRELSSFFNKRDLDNGQYRNLIKDVKDELIKLSKYHPILKAVHDKLFAEGVPESKHVQFIQVFNKVKSDVIVTELDKGHNSKVFNATYFTSRERKAIENFSANLQSKLFTINKVNGKMDINETNVDNIRKAKVYLMELSSRINTMKSYDYFKRTEGLNLLKHLNAIGIDIADPYEYISVDKDGNEKILKYDTFKVLDYFVRNHTGSELKYIRSQLIVIPYVLDKLTKGVTVDDMFKADIFASPLESNSAIRQLALAKAAFNYNSPEHTIKTADNKTLWVYGLVSYLKLKESQLKDKNYLENLMKVPGFKRSRLASYLLATDIAESTTREEDSKKRMSKFNIQMFGSIQNASKDKMVGNTDLTKMDALLSDLKLGLSYLEDSKNGIIKDSRFSTITGADKSTRYLINSDLLELNVLNTDGTISDKAINIFFNYFLDEVDVINNAVRESSLNENPAESLSKKKRIRLLYHADSNGTIGRGNALKFNIFKDFNYDNVFAATKGDIKPEDLYNSDGKTVKTSLSEETTGAIKKHITNMLNQAIAYQLNEAIELGILKDDQSLKNNTVLDKDLRDKYITGRNMMAVYTLNGIMYNIDYITLFLGGAANFKNEVEIIKRNSGAQTDGLVPVLGISENDWRLNMVTINNQFKSNKPYLQVLKEFNKEAKPNNRIPEATLSNWYNESNGKTHTNITDAQGWITIHRWLFLMDRLGKGKNLDEIKRKIDNREDLTEEEIHEVIMSMDNEAQPMKGVYFGSEAGKTDYVKYSQMVLIPQFVKGTDLEHLYNKMVYGKATITSTDKPLPYVADSGEAQQAHEVVVGDGVKLGSLLHSDISEETYDEEGRAVTRISPTKLDSNWNVNVLDNYYWKLQQDLPTKHIKDRLLGSQVKNLILDGLADIISKDSNAVMYHADTGEEIKVSEVFNMVHTLAGQLSNKGLNKVRRMLGTYTDVDGRENLSPQSKEKLRNMLIDEFSRDPNKNAQIIHALRMGVSFDGLVGHTDKIQEKFFSIINKAVVKYQTSGMGAIQASSFGTYINTEDINKSGIFLLKDVRDLRAAETEVLEVDGKKRIRVKPSQVFMPHAIIAKHIPNYRELTREQLLSKIDSRLLKLIGYRIPTQGMSSIDNLEIVGILPPELGDMIIPYAEITTKTGSDYDIDKMYLFMPEAYPVYLKQFDGLVREIIENEMGLKYPTIVKELERLSYDLDISSEDYDKDVNKGALSIAQLIADKREVIMDLETPTILKSIVNRLNSKLAETNLFIKLQYAKYNPSKGENNTTQAHRNKLLELYRTILESEYSFKNSIRPIDADNLKEDIIDLHGKEKSPSGILFYTPQYQRDARFNYYLGRDGIGSTANAQSDHTIGQYTKPLVPYLGIGKEGVNMFHGTSKSYSILDHDSSIEDDTMVSRVLPDGTISTKRLFPPYEKYRIVDIISAFLNAYVDIAKDPYISKGNHNLLTSGVVFTLLRNGINYKWVNAFIGQPALKEYTKRSLNRNSILNEEGYKDVIVDVKNYYIKKLIELRSEGVTDKKQLQVIKDKVLVEIAKFENSPIQDTINYLAYQDLKDILKGNNLSLQEDPMVQLAVLKAFEHFKYSASSIKKEQDASKILVNGPGRNAVDLIIAKNKVLNIYNSNSRFRKRFILPNGDKTMLGTVFNNAIIWPLEVLRASNFLAIFSEKAEQILNSSNYLINGSELLTDPDFGYLIANSMNTLLYADFFANGDSISTIYKDLVSLDNRVARTVLNFQQKMADGNLSDTEKLLIPLFDALTVTTTKNTQIVSLDMNEKTANFSRNISNAWAAMLNTGEDIEVTDGVEIDEDVLLPYKKFAWDLARHVFYTSKFNMQGNYLTSLIPPQLYIEFGIDTYMNDMSNLDILTADNVLDQIARHNIDESRVVKYISSKDINPFYFTLANGTTRKFLEGAVMSSDTYKGRYVKYTEVVNSGSYPIKTVKLYKYQGVVTVDDSLKFVYKRISMLGNNSSKNRFTESSSREYIKYSSIEKNALNNKIKEDLEFFETHFDIDNNIQYDNNSGVPLEDMEYYDENINKFVSTTKIAPIIKEEVFSDFDNIDKIREEILNKEITFEDDNGRPCYPKSSKFVDNGSSFSIE